MRKPKYVVCVKHVDDDDRSTGFYNKAVHNKKKMSELILFWEAPYNKVEAYEMGKQIYPAKGKTK